MLTSIKNKTQRTALIDLLTFIVAATSSAAGFAFVPKAEAEKLAKAEPTFLTLDPNVTDAEGNIKAVASQVAIDALKASTQTPAAPAPPAAPAAAEPEPMKFEMGVLDAIPEINRGGIKSDSYPFAQLKAPAENGGKFAFFFVPATEAQPNPAKRLVSTVSSANKKYGKLSPPRSFTVRKVVVDGKITGAQVIRTA